MPNNKTYSAAKMIMQKSNSKEKTLLIINKSKRIPSKMKQLIACIFFSFLFTFHIHQL